MDAFICAVPPVILQEELQSCRGQGSLKETWKAWRPRTWEDDGWPLPADPPNYSGPRTGPATRHRGSVPRSPSVSPRCSCYRAQTVPSAGKTPRWSLLKQWSSRRARLHYLGSVLRSRHRGATASVIGGLDGRRYEVNKRSSRLSQCQIQIAFLQFQLFLPKDLGFSPFGSSFHHPALVIYFIINQSMASILIQSQFLLRKTQTKAKQTL